MPRIPRSLVDAMIAHAREDLPNEACGVIWAEQGDPAGIERVTNITASPYRYEMDPAFVVRLMTQHEPADLFAIYHSHVASEARPSPTDVRMAFFPPGEIEQEPMFPEAYYVLVSLETEPPDVRAYHIRTGGEIEEEPIEVVSG